ncbi:MAG: sugar ABC transporter permease [Chloroflexi bacterium]|nr:sugar ABC transporter permease [Chloroflexota bacterium]
MAVETASLPSSRKTEKSFFARLVGTRRRRDTVEGYLFIMPVVLGLLFFTIGPMLASFYISFTKYPILRSPEWIGLRNYVNMFTKEPNFWQSVKVTLLYAITAVPLGILGAFLLALLLNQRIKGMSFFRTSFYIPTIVPAVASAVLWGWLLNPDYGLINAILKGVGLPTSRFLGEPNSALASLVLMSLWSVGGGMVIYLAGLQGIPETFYEAAKIDGANSRQLFRFITVPLMTPTLFFGLVMGLIGAFQYFTEAFILTQGGPLFSTYFYSLMVYERAFRFTQMGMATAMAWVLLLVVLSLTLLVFRSSALWVFYETEVK